MHEIWDDTEANPGTLPYTCHDCGEGQIAVVEFRRNKRWSHVCFQCVRSAAASIDDHEAERR